MFGNLLTGWHLIIILAVVLLLFGATKLPALSKSVGQSIRIFRGEMKSMSDENPKTDAAEPQVPAATAAPTVATPPAPAETLTKP